MSANPRQTVSVLWPLPSTGILEQIRSSHNILRTKVVTGEYVLPPTIGRRFIMFAEPLEKGFDKRRVETSPVKSVTFITRGVVEFETANSTYRLTVASQDKN